jgi:hypothetical protein
MTFAIPRGEQRSDSRRLVVVLIALLLGLLVSSILGAIAISRGPRGTPIDIAVFLGEGFVVVLAVLLGWAIRRSTAHLPTSLIVSSAQMRLRYETHPEVRFVWNPRITGARLVDGSLVLRGPNSYRLHVQGMMPLSVSREAEEAILVAARSCDAVVSERMIGFLFGRKIREYQLGGTLSQ